VVKIELMYHLAIVNLIIMKMHQVSVNHVHTNVMSAKEMPVNVLTVHQTESNYLNVTVQLNFMKL